MDDERQGVVAWLKAIVLRQQGFARSGRRDGRVCAAVELKVVGDGPCGDARQLDAISCTNTDGYGKK